MLWIVLPYISWLKHVETLKTPRPYDGSKSQLNNKNQPLLVVKAGRLGDRIAVASHTFLSLSCAKGFDHKMEHYGIERAKIGEFADASGLYIYMPSYSSFLDSVDSQPFFVSINTLQAFAGYEWFVYVLYLLILFDHFDIGLYWSHEFCTLVEAPLWRWLGYLLLEVSPRKVKPEIGRDRSKQKEHRPELMATLMVKIW